VKSAEHGDDLESARRAEKPDERHQVGGLEARGRPYTLLHEHLDGALFGAHFLGRRQALGEPLRPMRIHSRSLRE